MWLVIVIGAYFLNALASVVDKFLISKKIPNPAVYTFYISLLGLVGLILIPWGFAWPGPGQFSATLAGGFTFVFGLFYLFKALSLNESSRVLPVVGGFSPVFVFIFSYFFLVERLSVRELLAFALVVLGTVVISYEAKPTAGEKRSYSFAIFSALLFGVSYTLTKYIYNSQPFVSGFVWLRVATCLGALLLLLKPANRRAIIGGTKGRDIKVGGLFLFGQMAGASSFILVNYAISLTSVTLVNALQGTQYAFLLILILILSRFRPQILQERLGWKILIQKIVAIILIGAGLALLV